MTRRLVVFIVTVAATDALGLGHDGSCPILTLLPFTNQEVPRDPPQVVSQRDGPDAHGAIEEPLKRWPNSFLHHFAYSHMAAAELAIRHFNARNPVVVPELARLDDCSVLIPYQMVVDDALRDTKSIMALLATHHNQLADLFTKSGRPRSPNTLPNHVAQRCPSLAELDLLPPWCAVLGPTDDRAITQTSALTGALEIPQMIYRPVGHLALAEAAPTTVGLALPDLGRAKATISYLQRPGLERQYLAILNAPVPGISGIVEAIKSLSGKESGLKTISKESIRIQPGESPRRAYQGGVSWLRRTGIKTIMLGLNDPAEIQGYAEVLEEEGMLENGYMYLLLEEGVSLDRVSDIFGELEPLSPLDKLLSGAAVISQTDKFAIMSAKEDPFEKVWKMQNASFVEYLNSMTPKDEETGKPLFQAEPTFFQDQPPAAMTSFMYDSVIAVGLGACRHKQHQDGPQHPIAITPLSNQDQEEPSLQGQPLHPGQPQGGTQQLFKESSLPGQVGEEHIGQGFWQPPHGQQQGQYQQQDSLPSHAAPGMGRLLESTLGGKESSLPPTVDSLFAKIESALHSMQRHDNTSEFVSRVQVTYNDTIGYPQRMLIVYDIPRVNTSDPAPRSYNEFTFFATITDIESLQRGLKFGLETPAPSIEDSTTITTHSELQQSLEVFNQARSLWDSHQMMNYQFQYDLFFDTKTGANRHLTPYPWRVVVEDLRVATITDARGSTLVSSTDSSSSVSSVVEETATSIVTNITHRPPSTSNLGSTVTSAVAAENTTTHAPGRNPNATSAAANVTTQVPEQPQHVKSEGEEVNGTVSLAPLHMPSILNMTETEIQTIPPQQQKIESGSSEEDPINTNNHIHANYSLSPLALPPEAPLSSVWSPEGIKLQGGRGKGGPKLVDSILESSFSGASGHVSFRYGIHKSRDLNGVPVAVYNIQPTAVNQSTGLRSHSTSLTSYSILTNDTALNAWSLVKMFVYRDGSASAPTVLRQINVQNFLSEWVHLVGLTLFASAFFIAVSCAICVWWLSNDSVMRTGQPPSLYLLCFGSVMMSGAIFTLSWDESYGWSQLQLDIACTLTPWFFFVGYLLVFSSLCTKMWRVDQVMQLKRGQTVHAIQVMGPLVLFLLTASIVLSSWTLFDPMVWERTLTQENPPASYGECTCNDFFSYFLFLIALIVLATMTAAAMAWKTADIPQDFSDTSSVFYAISTHLQAWFIGIPVLVGPGSASTDATYFGRVVLIWVFSVSGVFLVVVPKIAKSLQIRSNPSWERKSCAAAHGMGDSVSQTRISYNESATATMLGHRGGLHGRHHVDSSANTPLQWSYGISSLNGDLHEIS